MRIILHLFWCAAEAAKVKAEQAVHELQLDMRGQVEKYNQLQEARRCVTLFRASLAQHMGACCNCHDLFMPD